MVLSDVKSRKAVILVDWQGTKMRKGVTISIIKVAITLNLQVK